MIFHHRPFQPGETIAAIATPPGEGGVAIVRISGDRAIEIGNRVFSGDVSSYKTHTAHYGWVIDNSGKRIDGALVLVMLGRRSYTGEDTVEIHCHGGTLISRRVLDVTLVAGARAAQPGEFTFKAFMNGKIDLAQAEAVQELIHAKNDLALDAAEDHLEGRLSRTVKEFQSRLVETAAILEAWVDFPEEGLEFATMDETCQNLESVRSDMEQLLRTFQDGRIAHDGISTCLIGAPNVGKSSLMNALLERDRAIVTHIAGTTRDLLEDDLRLNGLNLRLIDTAGIRETAEIVEQEGIRRSRNAMQQSDLVLLLLDCTNDQLSDTERELINSVPPEKTIVIWNKSDVGTSRPGEVALPHSVTISAKCGTGLDELRSAIDSVIWSEGPPDRDQVMITNVRHKEALSRSIDACQRVINGLRNDVSPEFVTLDMRACLVELGMIIGTDISDAILSSIFSKFCIGK